MYSEKTITAYQTLLKHHVFILRKSPIITTYKLDSIANNHLMLHIYDETDSQEFKYYLDFTKSSNWDTTVLQKYFKTDQTTVELNSKTWLNKIIEISNIL